MDDSIISWLIEDKNPAVKYRTRRELLGETADVAEARDWIMSKLPPERFETKCLWYTYYLTALAECGLTYADVPTEYFSRAVDELPDISEHGCADFMLLRALVMLGLGDSKKVRATLTSIGGFALPDNGYLCRSREKQFKYAPKSCYKVNIHALMLAGECKKRGIGITFADGIAEYFLKRNVFYKSSEPDTLVLDGNEGWRTFDVFHPFEPMRVGVHNVTEALCALGHGNDVQMKAAWDRLDALTDESGRLVLQGTLTKSYLTKEKVGSGSKWATFYLLLARQEK